MGSETIPSGAHRLSSSPVASGVDTDARPAAASFFAESAEKRTTVGVNGGTGTVTSGRSGAAAGAGAVEGSGTGTDWQASAASIPAAPSEVSRDQEAPFER